MLDDSIPTVNRSPNEVDLFCFYTGLWPIASRKAAGQRLKFDTDCSFTADEVRTALLEQGIPETDFDTAVEHCLNEGWIEKCGDNYHPTTSGLDNYNTLLRRI